MSPYFSNNEVKNSVHAGWGEFYYIDKYYKSSKHSLSVAQPVRGSVQCIISHLWVISADHTLDNTQTYTHAHTSLCFVTSDTIDHILKTICFIYQTKFQILQYIL